MDFCSFALFHREYRVNARNKKYCALLPGTDEKNHPFCPKMSTLHILFPVPAGPGSKPKIHTLSRVLVYEHNSQNDISDAQGFLMLKILDMK